MTTKTETVILKAKTAICDYSMLAQDSKVLAAVSGGADSVCMLVVLCELGYETVIAHIDHQTRDGQSAQDAAFVKELACEYGLPCFSESVPVEQESQGSGMSFEEFAREVRYDFLEMVAEEQDCSHIATGHHADDQAETILMRLLRGVSAHGLAGIPPIRELGGIKVIRPLHLCSRDEILGYLEEKEMQFRTDASNSDTRYLRNRIRHELMPQLTEEYNPNLRQALQRLGETQFWENKVLTELTEKLLSESCLPSGGIDREAFTEAHVAIQRRALKALAWRQGVDCAFGLVEGARLLITAGRTGQSFDMGGGLILRNGRDVTEMAAQPEESRTEIARLEIPGETTCFGKRFSATFSDTMPLSEVPGYCCSTRQVFDAATISSELTIRGRINGDRFRPLGMSGSKTIGDYFTDIGLPATRRDNQPLLVCGEKIAWVVGHAASADFAATESTEKLVVVEVSDEIE